ncbi:MAG: SDR family oxidoreductase, partial [Conexibacter sp.]
RGEAVAQELRAQGGEACFVEADVARSGDAQRAVDAALEAYGRLDCAVNSAASAAGIGAFAADVAEDAFDEQLAITLKGVWLCMRAELPALLAHGGGAIVNVSSINGLRATPGASAYAAAKHAVVGLTTSAALEYAAKGVRINAVCPGPTRTPMLEGVFELHAPGDPASAEAAVAGQIPSGRVSESQELGAAIAWLCSAGASSVVGQAIAVDGGASA